MDFIFIEGMRTDARVGIYPHERLAAQTVEINMSFGIPANAAQRDDIADTISYDLVVDRIRAQLAERHFNLLEALGEFIVRILFDEFKAPWVRVSIVKPGVLHDVRRVGVYLERGRDGVNLPAVPVGTAGYP